MAESGLIRREVRIAAPPERVFQYFTDPARVARWLAPSATIDARPGGTFHLRFPGGDEVVGSIIEIDAPRRIAFTWGWQPRAALPQPQATVPPGSSLVEFTLRPEGDETVVEVTHTRLPMIAIRVHDEGWQGLLAQLRTLAESEG